MAFTTNARVRVSSENSQSRGLLGTVKVIASESDTGCNEVHIDGYPVGKRTLLRDDELMSSTLPDPLA